MTPRAQGYLCVPLLMAVMAGCGAGSYAGLSKADAELIAYDATTASLRDNKGALFGTEGVDDYQWNRLLNSFHVVAAEHSQASVGSAAWRVTYESNDPLIAVGGAFDTCYLVWRNDENPDGRWEEC